MEQDTKRRRDIMPRGAPLYLEDLAPGQTFGSGTVTVDPIELKEFAAEFDPQPFHLDDEAARASLFGGLVASGWHTAALTMRLLVDGELNVAGGLIGAGVDEMQWPRPVRPGDVLHVESEVLEVRPSNSRPDRGMVRLRSTTRNQDDLPVMIQVARLIVPRRPA
jgi:acyl dehydratase